MRNSLRIGRRGACLPLLSQLRHRAVQAALDPPLVDQQPVQHLGAGEIRHHHLPQDHLFLVPPRFDLQPMLGPEHHVVGVLAVDRGEDGALQPLGPPQPPGQAHRPLGQQPLHRPDRRQLREHPLAVELELGRVFSVNDHLLGQKPMFNGIPRRRRLAFRGPRPGGLLRIGSIGLNLSNTRHEEPSELISYCFALHIALPTYQTHILVLRPANPVPPRDSCASRRGAMAYPCRTRVYRR
jgi:hypothetical protein